MKFFCFLNIFVISLFIGSAFSSTEDSTEDSSNDSSGEPDIYWTRNQCGCVEVTPEKLHLLPKNDVAVDNEDLCMKFYCKKRKDAPTPAESTLAAAPDATTTSTLQPSTSALAGRKFWTRIACDCVQIRAEDVDGLDIGFPAYGDRSMCLEYYCEKKNDAPTSPEPTSAAALDTTTSTVPPSS